MPHTRYKFLTRIKRIEERSRAIRAHKEGDEVIVERQPLGWFVVMEGSWEAMHLGFDKPDMVVGDTITVTIERTRQDAIPWISDGNRVQLEPSP